MTNKYAWITIQKNKPDLGKPVLLVDEFGWIFIGKRIIQHDLNGISREKYKPQIGENAPGGEVKYWMDLPEVPDECQIL